jgi:hypothetical protein
VTTVVTGWTGRGYDPLGRRFLETFLLRWPKSVNVLAFTDRGSEIDIINRRDQFKCFPLSDCDGLAEFQAQHAHDPLRHGRVPNDRWKDKERAAGYSFRWDACKFATQLFIPEGAAKHLPDGEIMAWFDADVVTTADVPEGFIEGLIGDADLVYLGRPKHSEIGFWAVRLSPRTRQFIWRLAEIYRDGDAFWLAETHSAWVFDRVRMANEYLDEMRGCDSPNGNFKTKNLTPGGRGHVWPTSPLGRYTRHDKGKRKWKP